MLALTEFSRMFDFEEKMVLNKSAVGVSKKAFLDQCSFSKAVTEDDECIALLSSVAEKVEKLSDEEWEELKQYIPFDVPVLDADVDEAV